MTLPLRLAPEVADTLESGGPVVALETTAISHGLPFPANLELARRAGVPPITLIGEADQVPAFKPG